MKQNKQRISATSLLIGLLSLISVPSIAQLYGDNYIIFEAEETSSPLGYWQIIKPGDSRYLDDPMVSPINNTHLEFTGNSEGGGNPTSPLKYTFICPKTAKYYLAMRMYQRLEGAPGDKCNDVWVRMEGNFTSGNAYTQEDLETDMKVYGRGKDAWGTLYKGDSHTSGKKRMMYNFIKGETYTLIVSGRSKRTNIDYIILYDGSLPIVAEESKDFASHNDAKYRPNHSDPIPEPTYELDLSEHRLILQQGEKADLSASLNIPEDTDSSLMWQSKNPELVSVDANGEIMALANGMTYVYASVANRKAIDSCLVYSLGISTGNIALNKPIIASAHDENVPMGLVDGILTDDSRWSANGFPQWVEIDLGRSYHITQSEVICFQSRPYHFTIEGKVSHSDEYVQFVDRSDNYRGGTISRPIKDEIEDGFEARYVKLNVSGINDNSSEWVSLVELRLFGDIVSPVKNINKALYHVYPSVFQHSVQVELGQHIPTSIELIDMSGSVHLVKEMSHSGSLRLDVPQGMYILKLTNAGGTITFPLLKP